MKNDSLYIQEIEKLKNSGNYEEAKRLTQKHLLSYTDDYRLYEELADIHLFEGDIDKASNAMSFAQNLNPESATGLYLAGYINLSKGNFRLGVEQLEKANLLFPNNPEILRNLGWGYTMSGKTAKGITILKRALNISPEDILIMEDLGVALMGDGQTELGEFYLKKAGREDRLYEMRSYLSK